MGAAGDLGPYQRVFRVKIRGVDSLESVPSYVVVAVSRRALEVGFADMGVLHGFDDPQLIVFGCLIDLFEAPGEPLQYGRGVIKYQIRYTELPVNRLHKYLSP